MRPDYNLAFFITMAIFATIWAPWSKLFLTLGYASIVWTLVRYGPR